MYRMLIYLKNEMLSEKRFSVGLLVDLLVGLLVGASVGASGGTSVSSPFFTFLPFFVAFVPFAFLRRRSTRVMDPRALTEESARTQRVNMMTSMHAENIFIEELLLTFALWGEYLQEILI